MLHAAVVAGADLRLSAFAPKVQRPVGAASYWRISLRIHHTYKPIRFPLAVKEYFLQFTFAISQLFS